MNRWYKAIATAALVITVAAAPAMAETYRAGNFTITLTDDYDDGRVYYGCDSRGNCLRLKYGTAWRDNGYRGITWENGNYTYSVSWQEGNPNARMYLNVFEGDRRIVREAMSPMR